VIAKEAFFKDTEISEGHTGKNITCLISDPYFFSPLPVIETSFFCVFSEIVHA
jgi:hypothetical protein